MIHLLNDSITTSCRSLTFYVAMRFYDNIEEPVLQSIGYQNCNCKYHDLWDALSEVAENLNEAVKIFRVK